MGCCSRMTVYQDPHLFVRMPVTAESRENYPEASCAHENVISRAEAKLQSQSGLTAQLTNEPNILKIYQPITGLTFERGGERKS